MKKSFLLLGVVGVALFASCNEKINKENSFDGDATITISVSEVVSKATGVTQAQETAINKVDLFVFNGDNGVFDAYKQANNNSTQMITATSGEKHIYALANRQASFNETNVRTESDFLSQTASMYGENLNAFTMIGNKNHTLVNNGTNSVEVGVSRLVAKVALDSLKVNFAGSPLAGQSLENVKIYLKNVPLEKKFSGEDVATPTYISGKSSEWHTNANEVTLLYDEVAEIEDGSHTINHNFFPYDRFSASAQQATECIRVVITADIDANGDGTLENYTWSFPVNNLGDTATGVDAHYGVKANHTYSIVAQITRIGTDSNDPNAEYTDIDYSQNSISMNIVPWIVGNSTTVIF